MAKPKAKKREPAKPSKRKPAPKKPTKPTPKKSTKAKPKAKATKPKSRAKPKPQPQAKWRDPLRDLSMEGIRRKLAQPMADRTWQLFMQLATPLEDSNAAEIRGRWQRAIDAWDDLEKASRDQDWGSTPTKFGKYTSDALLLQAMQGVTAHLETVPTAMLAVLASEGSASSVDALIGHIDRAVTEQDDRLDVLALLRPHAARTPALDALFAELETTLDARRATSPALALGPLIGLGDVTELWFTSTITARERDHGVSRISGRVGVDSREPQYFSVFLMAPQRGYTQFDHDSITDQLDLGRCDVTDLPIWLATVAASFGVTWEIEILKTNQRGTMRDRILEWLVPTA